MIVYRIAQKKYIEDLSGTGAFLYGGRWNLKGTRAIYASSSMSLAYLEFLVHQFERDSWPQNLFISEILIKDLNDIIEMNDEQLPSNWRDLKYHGETQQIATNYFKKPILGLQLPSVIISRESNLILNPQYPNFNSLVEIQGLEELALDKRFGIT